MVRPPNGRVPSGALVSVQTGYYNGDSYRIKLETATAAAFKKAQKAGGLTITPPLGGDRSLDDQAHLKANPRKYGSDLPSSSIGSPGTSTHGWGDCVDIANGNAWFAAHCGRYGFVRESPAGENNHYRYLHPTWKVKKPSIVTQLVGSVKTLIAPSNGAKTMFLAVYKTQYALITEGHGVQHLDTGGYNIYKKAVSVAKYTSQESFDRVVADATARAAQ